MQYSDNLTSFLLRSVHAVISELFASTSASRVSLHVSSSTCRKPSLQKSLLLPTRCVVQQQPPALMSLFFSVKSSSHVLCCASSASPPVSFPMPLKQDTSVFQNLRAFEQSEHHRRQQVSESALVALRDQATSLFEDGDFVPAATRFVEVLLHSPDCTKSNFNLAVILQMMGA